MTKGSYENMDLKIDCCPFFIGRVRGKKSMGAAKDRRKRARERRQESLANRGVETALEQKPKKATAPKSKQTTSGASAKKKATMSGGGK